MRTTMLTATLWIPFILLGCRSNEPASIAPATGPATNPTSAATFTGQLRGGMMAIGGEHSGWVLQRQEGDLEVDVTRVFNQARPLDGQRVTIKGKIQRKQYVERGPVDVLVADSIRAAGR